MNNSEKLVVAVILLITLYAYVYHREIVDYTFLSGVAVAILGVMNSGKIFPSKKKGKKKSS